MYLKDNDKMEMDFVSAIKDEIALEGLDGVTLEALWLRLRNRQNFPIKLDEGSKSYLWNHLVRETQLDFYELPEPRPQLVLYSSLESYDPHTGRLIEPDEFPVDVYPINVINKDGIVGSCATYDSRVRITHLVRDEDRQPLLGLQQVIDKWGESFVIVASQSMRMNAIVGSDMDPNQSWLENGLTYCILEKIARSRFDGITSLGPCSLQAFDLSPKTMFYHTKILVKLGRIRKQSLLVMTMADRQQLRRIFHLSRFFKEIQSKYQILVRQVADYLSKQRNQGQLVSKTREDLELEEKTLKKLYKNYPQYFKTMKVFYRTLHPDADEKEYMCKNGNGEKLIHIITLLKHPDEDKKGSDDEDDDDDDVDVGSEKRKDFQWVYERSMLYQVYNVLTSAGPDGLTQIDLIKLLNIDRYSVRTLCRNMTRMNLVDVILKEDGKQKVQVYISKCLSESSSLYTEFQKEKSRIFDKPSSLGKSVAVKEKLSPIPSTVSAKTAVGSTVSSGDSTTPTSTVTDTTKEDTPTTITENQSASERCTPGKINVEEVDEHTFKSCFMKKSHSSKRTKADKRSEYMKHLTGRHLKRMSLILDAIQKDKILEHGHTFVKMIRESEKEEGLDFSADKKSCEKLVGLLAKEGKIRVLKTFVMHGDQRKEITLLCDRSVVPTDPIVQSTMEQLKMKYHSVSKQHLHDVKHKPKMTAKKSPQKLSQLIATLPKTTQENLKKIEQYRVKFKSVDMVYDPHAAKSYGFLPKMKKLRLIHNILWYLCYVHEEKLEMKTATNIGCQEDTAAESTGADDMYQNTTGERADNPSAAAVEDTAGDAMKLDLDIMTQLEQMKEPCVYCDEMSWKRYLPPLPKHKDYPPGWCLISDVLLTLPLSVFCSLVAITYQVRGLKELLDDPLKSLYPISHLPYKLTQQLLFARKYIYSFHENCEKLCYMGLLSFGAKILKEKDQVFVYIHRKAGIIDTTKSQLGYTRVRLPEPYVVKIRELDSQEELDHYWADLQEISLSSNMGNKSMREEEFERVDTEAVDLPLSKVFTPVTPETVVDEGIIPGDHQGAAGMDSSFFSHLPKNWDWNIIKNPIVNRRQLGQKTRVVPTDLSSSISSMPVSELTSSEMLGKYLKVSKPQRLPRVLPRERLTLVAGKGVETEVVTVSTTTNTKGNKGGKGVKRKTPPDVVAKDPCWKRKKKPYKPVVKKPGSYKVKKKFMDDIDHETVKYKVGQRVTWSSGEDSILLTCKIAVQILALDSYGHKRTLPVPWTEIRNAVRQYAKEKARDKSTEACKRRVAFTMKNPRSKHNLSIFMSEALQDQYVLKNFAQKKYHSKSEEAIADFHKLVDILINKFSCVDLMKSYLPSNLSELSQYTVKEIKHKSECLHFSDVTNTAEVVMGVLNNIVHSYVSLNDKQGRAYECYKLLSQYPDDLIRRAMIQMKKLEQITRVKWDEKKSRIPSGIQHYKLTQKYNYAFLTRFPSSLFEDASECLQLLTQESNKDILQGATFSSIAKGGYCACIVSLMSMKKLSFHVKIPRDLIILDPTQPSTRGRCVELWKDGGERSAARKTSGATKSVKTGLKPCKSKPAQQSKDTDEEDMDMTETTDTVCTQTQLPGGMEGQHKAEDLEKEATLDVDSSVSFVKTPSIAVEQSGLAAGGISISCKALSVVGNDSGIGSKEMSVEGDDVNHSTMTKVVTSPYSSLEMDTEDLGLPETEPQSEVKSKPTASRALITIRRSCIEDDASVKHYNFQDNFVIDSCVLGIKVMPKPQTDSDSSEKDIIADKTELSNILKRSLKTLPFEIDLEEVWKNVAPPLLDNVKKVYNLIDSSGDLGIRKHDLNEELNNMERLGEHLEYLENHNMIIKVGVTVARYVTLKNCRPWVVHAYKNTKGRGTRLDSTEKVDDLVICQSSAATQSATNKEPHASAISLAITTDIPTKELRQADENQEEISRPSTDILENDATNTNSAPPQSMGDNSNTDYACAVEGNSSTAESEKGHNLRKDKGKAHVKTVQSEQTPQPTGTYQRVRFLCVPWRKPEGTLNKPVFKMMLESLMFHIMSKPGVSQENIMTNYTSFNQPFLKAQLLQILEDLGAVQKEILRRPVKASLFSKRRVPTPEFMDTDDSTILYLPTKECVLRLGQFISYVCS